MGAIGLAPRAQWLARVGGMWADFSAVAAHHPNVWTRSPLSASAITTPAADNRPIDLPYTKRMVSLVMADLGAAVILTTAERAAATRGLRFIANTRGDSASFTALIDTNPVGSTVRLHHDGNVNIAELNI